LFISNKCRAIALFTNSLAKMADSEKQYKHSNLEDGRHPKMIRMNQSYEQQYEENDEEQYATPADG